MTQEEINDKFSKENHCGKYLKKCVSRYDGREIQVQTVTSFSADESKNPTKIAEDLVCVTIYDSDEEDLDGVSILLSRKETLSLIEKLTKAASLLRREYTD